jgi:hypothetical protein
LRDPAASPTRQRRWIASRRESHGVALSRGTDPERKAEHFWDFAVENASWHSPGKVSIALDIRCEARDNRA